LALKYQQNQCNFGILSYILQQRAINAAGYAVGAFSLEVDAVCVGETSIFLIIYSNEVREELTVGHIEAELVALFGRGQRSELDKGGNLAFSAAVAREIRILNG